LHCNPSQNKWIWLPTRNACWNFIYADEHLTTMTSTFCKLLMNIPRLLSQSPPSALPFAAQCPLPGREHALDELRLPARLPAARLQGVTIGVGASARHSRCAGRQPGHSQRGQRGGGGILLCHRVLNTLQIRGS